MNRMIWLALGSMMGSAGLCEAGEFFVRVDGNDANSGTSWPLAKKTIQAAVDLAPDSSTVWVSNGTYTVTYAAPSVCLRLTNDVTVTSVNGPAVTIIDAANTSSRRVCEVRSPGAALSGFTLKRGNWKIAPDGPGGLLLGSGTVTNCIIGENVNYRLGAGAYVTNWLLTECVFLGNHGDANGSSGGGLYISGGLVLNCAFSNNFVWATGTGGGIHAVGGVVSNCLIAANKSGQYNWPNNKGGGLYLNGGTVVGCTLVRNRCYHRGGGAYIVSGILRNCLLLDNDAEATTGEAGGGICMSGGSVENCTLFGNQAYGRPGDGIYMSGGTVSNSVVWGNGVQNLYQGGGRVDYSCVAPLPSSGSGNIDGNPLFLSEPARDCRLGIGSPCVDAGSNQVWMSGAPDAAGAVRLVNGVVDMGAHERPPSGTALQCNFAVTTNRGVQSLTVGFAAKVAGDDTSGITYVWDFGDGEGCAGRDQSLVPHAYAPGRFTVTLTVTNATGETASLAYPACIQVAAETCYVSDKGAHRFPFASWADAATDVNEAVDSGSATILITNGTYKVSGDGLYLFRDATIRGVNGPLLTILDAQNADLRRVLTVRSSGARVEGVTATKGKILGMGLHGGAGICLFDGLVTNCIIEKNSLHYYGGLWVQGGCVTDCIIRNHTTFSSGGKGAGFMLQGTGVMENCIVSNNHVTYISPNLGGGGYVAGGTLRNSLIAFNSAVYTATPGGDGAGLYVTGGSVMNCTVVSNRVGKSDGKAGGIYNDGGNYVNCIVYHNEATSSADIFNTVNFSYSCSRDLTAAVDHNITDDPLFVGIPARNFRLDKHSPCLDKGLDQTWMTSAADLDGDPRVQGRHVDMGAFEGVALKVGTVLLMR